MAGGYPGHAERQCASLAAVPLDAGDAIQPTVDERAVASRPAVHRVGAAVPAVQPVVAGLAEEDVGAAAAGQPVAARAAEPPVVPAQAVDPVVAAEAADRLVLAGADQLVGVDRAADRARVLRVQRLPVGTIWYVQPDDVISLRGTPPFAPITYSLRLSFLARSLTNTICC